MKIANRVSVKSSPAVFRWTLVALSVSFATALSFRAVSQQGGGYVQEVWTYLSGGGSSSGGEYLVSGAIGQIEGGSASGGQYMIMGGVPPDSEPSAPPSAVDAWRLYR